MSSSWRAAIFGIALLVSGCAAPAPAPSGTPATVGTPPATTTPDATPTADPTCPPAPTTPPIVTIENATGDEIEGFVVANQFCNGVLATPAFDPVPIPLAANEINVVIAVADGPPFVAWQVKAAGLTPSDVLTTGQNPAGVESISFAGPPSGQWSLTASLTFPGAMGSASYNWLVSAP